MNPPSFTHPSSSSSSSLDNTFKVVVDETEQTSLDIPVDHPKDEKEEELLGGKDDSSCSLLTRAHEPRSPAHSSLSLPSSPGDSNTPSTPLSSKVSPQLKTSSSSWGSRHPRAPYPPSHPKMGTKGVSTSTQKKSVASTEVSFFQGRYITVSKKVKDVRVQGHQAMLYLKYQEKDLFQDTLLKAEQWETLAYQLLDTLMDDLTPFQTDVLNETLLSIPNPQATIRDLVAKQFGFPVPDSLQSKFGDEQGDL